MAALKTIEKLQARLGQVEEKQGNFHKELATCIINQCLMSNQFRTLLGYYKLRPSEQELGIELLIELVKDTAGIEIWRTLQEDNILRAYFTSIIHGKLEC